MNSIHAVPKDIFTYSLSYLPIQDVAKTSRVCKDWRELTKPESIFWKYVLARDYARAEKCEQSTDYQNYRKFHQLRKNYLRNSYFESLIWGDNTLKSWCYGNDLILLSKDGNIEILDATTKKLVRETSIPKELADAHTFILKGSDEDLLLINSNNQLVVWNSKDHKAESIFNIRAQCVTISPKGQIVVGFNGGMIRFYNKKDSTNSTHSWKAHQCTVTRLLFADDGKLISGAIDGSIRIWNIETQEKELELIDKTSKDPYASITSLIFSKQQEIIVARSSKEIQVWDYKTGVLKHKFPLEIQPFATTFSKEGSLVISGHKGFEQICFIKNLDIAFECKINAEKFPSLNIAITRDGCLFSPGFYEPALVRDYLTT